MAFIKLAKIRYTYKVLFARCWLQRYYFFILKTSKFPSYSRASVFFFVHIGQTRQIIKYLTDTRCASIRGRQKEKAKMCRKCNGLQENALILKYLVNAEVHEIVFWRV